MKVSDYIAHFLKDKGIKIVFELQGGMITRLIDALHREGGIKIVSMHHEQAASMAADAFGRITNKPGIALATSGPGATNLLTGIGNCYFDSVPAIFITGQVNLNEQKGDLPIRQIGFQETDIVSMAKPITKEAYAIKTAKEIPHIFEEAYQIAISGRPGPVLIDLPMNIQNEEVEIPDLKVTDSKLKKDTTIYHAFFQNYLNALNNSKRPLILVGRGIRASGSIIQFLKFLQKYQIPTVTSLLGFDVLPFLQTQRVGYIGTYGNRWANYALGSCDLLLVLGSRLDLRQTGSDTTSFQHGKLIYHVDIDQAELNNRIKSCITLNTNLSDFFLQIKNLGSNYKAPFEWVNEVEEKKQAHLDTSELENITSINPNIFIHKLSQVSHKAKVFTADVGNNQMWCSQSLELTKTQLFLTSGGMGAMGYSLPAAIGASITMGNVPIVAIAGDGGFQINIQELQTIRRNNLPIKIVILNNHCLGMIRQFQDSYFASCYQSTVWGYDAPSFTKVALAYEIESCSISKPDEIDMGLAKLWGNPTQPFLLDVSIDIHTNVYPKIMFGSPLVRMEPEVSPN
ncbi:MAG: thiamine pyrophosphate-binding protein [Bacteroidia bacterium]|nr:thiamine pyrophosphate-binding protein [Bacteroidia bacterium]